MQMDFEVAWNKGCQAFLRHPVLRPRAVASCSGVPGDTNTIVPGGALEIKHFSHGLMQRARRLRGRNSILPEATCPSTKLCTLPDVQKFHCNGSNPWSTKSYYRENSLMDETE